MVTPAMMTKAVAEAVMMTMMTMTMTRLG